MPALWEITELVEAGQRHAAFLSARAQIRFLSWQQPARKATAPKGDQEVTTVGSRGRGSHSAQIVTTPFLLF